MFTLLLLITTLLYSAPNKDKDNFEWSSKKLSWSDYKGTPSSQSSFLALTSSDIGYSASFGQEQLIVTVNCKFNAQRSWTKVDTSDYLLNHEQRHFDITEYHTRQLRSNIKHYNFKNISEVNNELKKLFNEQFDLHQKMQKSYDEQTNHSINQMSQQSWNLKIDSLLLSRIDDTASQLVISLNKK